MRIPLILLLPLLLFAFQSCKEKDQKIDRWTLAWSDEFTGQQINLSNWEFDIGTGAPSFKEYGISSPYFTPKDFPNDNFSVRWEGQIKIDQSSTYTFYTISDDGVRLFIDGKSIINNWKAQPATENKGAIILQGNKTYPIVIEYFEEGGGEAMILGWESKNFTKRLITSANLTTNDGKPGLKGTYYKNRTLKSSILGRPVIRIDKELNWVTGGGWGNNEAQYYTDNPRNVRIQNGKLIIEALREDFYGSKYTSSRIKTKKSWKYGRFEIKAKLPKGVGTWAAFWGLPTEWKYGNWPNSGEIDVLEHVGFEEGHIVSSVHNIAHHGDLSRSDQTKYVIAKDVVNSFNDYVLEWDEKEIKTYINGKLIFSYPKNDQPWERWPFDQKFHFILNIAVGGNWGGLKGINDTAFPAKMEIEHFRVYKKNT